MVISGHITSGTVRVYKYTFIDDIILDDLYTFTNDVVQFGGIRLNNEILYKGFIIRNSLVVRVNKAFLSLLCSERNNFNIFTQILQDVLFNIYYNLSSFVNIKRSDYCLRVIILLDNTLSANKKKM